jgi:hypothetical protein
MRGLLPCRACGRHVFCDEIECPFCKASTWRAVAAPALAIGSAIIVAAAACGTSVDIPAHPQAGSGGTSRVGQTLAKSQSRASSATAGAGGTGTVRSGPASTSSTGNGITLVTTTGEPSNPDAGADGGNPCGTCPINSGCEYCYSCTPASWQCVPTVIVIYKSPPRRSDWS